MGTDGGKTIHSLLLCWLLGLTVVSAGCAPSIHKVVKVLGTVPVGASRTEVRRRLVEAFPRNVSEYDFTGSIGPLTKEEVHAD